MGWIEKDGTRYFRFTKTVGRTLNKNGVEFLLKRNSMVEPRKKRSRSIMTMFQRQLPAYQQTACILEYCLKNGSAAFSCMTLT